MLEGMFITVCGFSKYQDLGPFNIGSRFICIKEPQNSFDDDAVRVTDDFGNTLGYIANSAQNKANGTLSASRIYDKVGGRFLVEVCFTTRTKVICLVVDSDFKGVSAEPKE